MMSLHSQFEQFQQAGAQLPYRLSTGSDPSNLVFFVSFVSLR